MEAGLIHCGGYFAKNFTIKENTTCKPFWPFRLPGVLLQPVIAFFYDFGAGDAFCIQMDTG